MCKKLMFLISFVVVLGLVSSASAATWTNAAPGDDEWNTAGNWDTNTVPGGGDSAIIDAPPSRGPVIGSDVTVGAIVGLRLTSNDDQIMDISSGNVQIGWWERLAEAGTGTATLNMVGDANIALGGIEAGYDGTTVINIGGTTVVDTAVEWRICNEDDATVYLNIADQANIRVGPEKNAWRFADKGTMVTTISGNPTIVIEGKWRNSDESGHSVVNMSGGSVYTDRYMSCYDDGMATFSFSGGTVDTDGLSYAGGGTEDLDENPYTLNVSGSANVTARTEIRLGYQASPLNSNQASVTLNQTGGTLQTPGPFNAFGAKCPVNISLTGGELRCGSFQDQPDTRPYSLYICGGELVVQGDVAAQMQADIDAGYITGCAYGSPPLVEVDGGETTLSSPGGDFVWTGDYPWSMLWISPWNWDPIPPYGGPGTCDDTAIIEASGGPIVLDTAINIGEIKGPGIGADADQDMYLIKDCDLVVCDRWEVEETGLYTATIWVQDNAKVDIDEDFRAHEDPMRCIMNLSDNAEFVIGGDLRHGDNEDGLYFELNMTDNSYLSNTRRDDGMRADHGEFHINLSGNAVLEAEYIRQRTRDDELTCTWSISEDAQLLVTDEDDDVSWQIAGGKSTVVIDLLDNALVDLFARLLLGEDNDFADTLTLNMPCPGNQLLNIGEDLRFFDDNCDGTIVINLDGGVINVEGELDWEDDMQDSWVINMCCDGLLILAGDQVDMVLELVEAGNIVPCPMEDCRGVVVARGTILVDYNDVTDKTTVSSELALDEAWSPLPTDGATDVPSQGTELCWCPPEVEGGIKDTHVWFSTDCDAVARRDPEAFLQQAGTDTCVDVGCLELCTTYCWAVDIQDHYANIVRGPVWTFTTECCRMIEPFDEYTLDPWSLIYKAWYDGCGYWDVLYGDPVLISNGTGSCVNLGMDNTQDGPKAMIYTYENDEDSLWDRDVNWSEATKDFDPALDLECSNDKALVVYFYGNGDNDVTDMWLKLGDGASTVKSTYGAYGEDPANIQIPEWRDWNTKISDLAAINLAAVTEMSIGFGDDETGIADGTFGMMLFDSIQVCATRCVPQFVLICDLNDDCIVDWKDVKIIGDNWLEDRR